MRTAEFWRRKAAYSSDVSDELTLRASAMCLAPSAPPMLDKVPPPERLQEEAAQTERGERRHGLLTAGTEACGGVLPRGERRVRYQSACHVLGAL